MENNTNINPMNTNITSVKGKGLARVITIIIIVAILAVLGLKIKEKNKIIPQTQSEIDLSEAVKSDKTSSITTSLDDINLDDPISEDIKTIDQELQNL